MNAVAIVGALLLVACLGAFLVAPKLHRFAYWIGRQDRSAIAAMAQGGWQVDVLGVGAEVELVGLVRAPQDPAARWLLFLPGNATDVAGGFRPVLEPLARARGVGVAFWPWRGFDASTGQPSPAGLLADARAAWRHCTEDLGVRSQQLELWGYSLGSGIAVQLAAELCARGTPPAQVVLLSAYDRIPVMRHGPFGRFLADDVYDAIAVASAVTCPVTIVHGTADDALPIEGARALQRAIGAHAQFVELPGRGHVDYLSDLALLRW